MKTMIENFINGNLAEAKRQTKRFSKAAIALYLRDELGYSANKADLTAAWLKGADCWQEACDAK